MGLFGRKKDGLIEEERKIYKEAEKLVKKAQRCGGVYLGIKYLDEALKIKPNYGLALLMKGNSLHNLKKYEEAISYFDKVIQLEPNNTSVWLSKGDTLYDLRKYEEAISCYDELLRLEPNSISGFTMKNFALDKLTDLKNKKSIERKGWSEIEKEQVRIDQDGKCALCHKPPPRWEYDHIDGNRSNDSVSNCQGLCPNCHSIKTHEEAD